MNLLTRRYWDVWAASAAHHYHSQAHRMSHVFSHAASAMLVTSATTVFSFITNLASPFPGISTFGCYAGLLVFVNYCLWRRVKRFRLASRVFSAGAVVTFFPCACLVYDKYLKDRPPLCKRCTDALPAKLGAFFGGPKKDDDAGRLPKWFCDASDGAGTRSRRKFLANALGLGARRGMHGTRFQHSP